MRKESGAVSYLLLRGLERRIRFVDRPRENYREDDRERKENGRAKSKNDADVRHSFR